MPKKFQMSNQKPFYFLKCALSKLYLVFFGLFSDSSLKIFYTEISSLAPKS